MAKDPAFLFYSNDFLSGTFTMTDEQVGKYIRLLCLQHQKLQLSKKDMLSICKTYDEDIFSKFAEKDGFYFNQRLRDEATKRAKYTESRRNNAKPKETTDNDLEHMPKHMEDVNENRNEDKDKKEKKVIRAKKEKNIFKVIPPSLEDVSLQIQKRELSIDAEYFVNYYESNGWKVGKNPMKDWNAVLTTWSKNNFNNQNQNGTTQQRQKNGFGNNSKFGETEIERQRQIANELLAERGYQTIEPAGSSSDTGQAI